MLWTAGGIPIQERRFKDVFYQKAQSRMICAGYLKENRVERWLFDKPDFIFTGCGILSYRRSTLFAVAEFECLFGEEKRPRRPSGQGIGSWLACHEFEPSATKDPPCQGWADFSRAWFTSNDFKGTSGMGANKIFCCAFFKYSYLSLPRASGTPPTIHRIAVRDPKELVV
ncbi:hypothetical protein TNCV_1627951 [Trichonephila clavipes]|nr:hypothetical protein TNCV_1627951 [Trichonephila clavipes]